MGNGDVEDYEAYLIDGDGEDGILINSTR